MGHRRGHRGLATLMGDIAMLWLFRPVVGFGADVITRAAANRSGSMRRS